MAFDWCWTGACRTESTSLVNRSGSGRAQPKDRVRWFEPHLRLQNGSECMIVICLIGPSPFYPSTQLNADRRQGSGSGASPWSGSPIRHQREEATPCALPCPLLRSTHRAGRVGRERRRPMAATPAQEVFGHHAQALGAETWSRSSPTTATTPSTLPRQASNAARTASARPSPSSSARYRRPLGTSRPPSTRTTACC
jgi:hypothetical protein